MMETAMRYQPNEFVETPHGNYYVWRYMAREKFEKMIESSALFFPNAKMLSDEFEVTLPDDIIEKKRQELASKGLQGRKLKEKVDRFCFSNDPKKELTLVNCWSMRPDESYALWKIYLGGNRNGVAIRSTVGRLKRSIENGNDPIPEDFVVGRVNYRRQLAFDQLNRHDLILTKKPFYDFEHELRLAILHDPLSEGDRQTPYKVSKGRNVQVNLRELIDRIYLSPFSDESYVDCVRNVIDRDLPFLKKDAIRHSEIRDK